ncbi:hypothetical protein [Acidithiobacillus ferrianus]|uniref:hypothetical protein n=1 Tax=Acidithiobacillus ferrianus TaxID=2678518 RepID=UPI003F732FEC
MHYWRKRFADALEPRPMVHGTKGFLPVTLAPVRPSVSPVPAGCTPWCASSKAHVVESRQSHLARGSTRAFSGQHIP